MLGWPAAAFCLVEAPGIVGVLYGREYAASSDVLRILAPTIPLAFLSAPILTLFIGTDRERLYAKIMGLGAVTNVTLDLLLVPAYGPNAAAATTLATEVVVLAAALLAYSRLGLPPLRLVLPIRAFLAGVALAAALFGMRAAGFPLFARAGLGLLVLWPAAAFALGAARWGELRLLLSRR